jgi:putative endonuclease
MNCYYVYLLKCSDDSYYTGVTNNLERRVAEHQEGENSKAYTFKRRPVVLVFFETFIDINEAIEFEKQVKGWTRKKKEALIEQNWEKMHELAKCQNKTSNTFYKINNK